MDIPKSYDPHIVEDKWYKYWQEKGYFQADVNSSKESFSIVIPPPNVTGSLHMGHALNNTIQDILIRWKRMQGYNTIWIPGTDHAGIATQNVVERQLKQEGLSRTDLGREEFINRVWKWKDTYGDLIIKQLMKLGASCDWSNLRFTMDNRLSKAVREVFVRLYQEDLIYRDYYIVNWCPRCHTALSDIEVEHQTIIGHLYYLKYPLKDGGEIIVATTRPETMLGDTAVAVNPNDNRYKDLIGQEVILPVLNRLIPIIPDEFVDPEFGTGAVKVTPAHDPNDFEIGKRHSLSQINILNPDATINENAGIYQGQDRYECRKNLLEELKTQGLLVKVEDYSYAVGHCYRCRTVVEPYLSYQWFVKMKDLAEPAIEAVKNRDVEFIPSNWEKTYFEWMNNIKDWCISRQIWWGHRIPVWYCQECKAMMVAQEDPSRCSNCNSDNLLQDEDVLDTWFSSALWPFSTLGWPEKTDELKIFYPTTVLSTGFDIIFFWVARMIMMGLKFMGKVPFRQVYIHALIRDADGQKMSKSKGNVVDPLAVVENYGTDALRFTLSIMAVAGRDILLSEERIEGYRHFCNKIWNTCRFILMNTEDIECNTTQAQTTPLSVDRWIESRLAQVIEETTKSLNSYSFNEASQTIYNFVWHEYCDWYLELIKPDLRDAGQRRRVVQYILINTFEQILRLLHPFMPFITEELWQNLPKNTGTASSIMIAKWPTQEGKEIDKQAITDMELIQEIISSIRNIRSEMQIPHRKQIETLIIKGAPESLSSEQLKYLTHLTNTVKVVFDAQARKPVGSATIVVRSMEIYISLAGIIDLEKEQCRLKKGLAEIEQEIVRIQSKLDNEGFRAKAPAELISKEEKRKAELIGKREKLMSSLNSITTQTDRL